MERRDQRLAHLKEYLLSTHIIEDYPEFVEFFELYLKYLDDESTGYYRKIINILDNNDYMRIYNELLDFYFTHYFNSAGAIPSDLIIPGTDQKRLYIVLSKLINNLKGTRSSFEIMTAYMNGAQYSATPGTSSTISLDLNDFISHDESYWDYYYRYGRQGYDYPFSYSYNASLSEIAAISSIEPVLDLLQPAGYVFRILVAYPEDGSAADSITLSEIFEIEDSANIYVNVPYKYDSLHQFSGVAEYKGVKRITSFTAQGNI